MTIYVDFNSLSKEMQVHLNLSRPGIVYGSYWLDNKYMDNSQVL